MLKELVHEKINEVFLEYQNAQNVIDGGINHFDALKLDEVENELVSLIERVVAYQPKAIDYDKFVPSWYIYTDSEGIAHSENCDNVDLDMFLYKVSKRIAFDDIDGITVQKIYFRGKELEYAGWQPGMKFEFTDLNGKTVWVGQFEEWDH